MGNKNNIYCETMDFSKNKKIVDDSKIERLIPIIRILTTIISSKGKT